MGVHLHQRPKDIASCYEFNVLLFAPGQPAAGVRARLGFKDGVISAEGQGIWLTVLADQVGLRLGGFDGRQWMLFWETPEGMVSALLRGESDLRQMARLAPPALAAQIDARLNENTWLTHRWRALIAIVVAALLLPLLLVALFWVNSERIAGWASGHVSVEQEMRLGEMAFNHMRPELKLVESGPAHDMVRQLGERLTQGSRYRYHWYLADSSEVNAFAMPGGYVVVYTGLMRAAGSPEEVAGVLAHEVQHVEQRHSLRNMIHSLGWRAVLSIALGDWSGGAWAEMAHRLGSLKYGRDLETEADLAGLAALRRAGIAPTGMASFFEKLMKQDGGRITLLSTHPASEARLAALREAIRAQGNYAARPLPYDWPAIQASLGQVR